MIERLTVLGGGAKQSHWPEAIGIVSELGKFCAPFVEEIWQSEAWRGMVVMKLGLDAESAQPMSRVGISFVTSMYQLFARRESFGAEVSRQLREPIARVAVSVRRHIDGSVTPPGEVARHCSLLAVVSRMMARDENERNAGPALSAATLASLLDVIATETIHSTMFAVSTIRLLVELLHDVGILNVAVPPTLLTVVVELIWLPFLAKEKAEPDLFLDDSLALVVRFVKTCSRCIGYDNWFFRVLTAPRALRPDGKCLLPCALFKDQKLPAASQVVRDLFTLFRLPDCLRALGLRIDQTQELSSLVFSMRSEVSSILDEDEKRRTFCLLAEVIAIMLKEKDEEKVNVECRAR